MSMVNEKSNEKSSYNELGHALSRWESLRASIAELTAKKRAYESRIKEIYMRQARSEKQDAKDEGRRRPLELRVTLADRVFKVKEVTEPGCITHQVLRGAIDNMFKDPVKANAVFQRILDGRVMRSRMSIQSLSAK